MPAERGTSDKANAPKLNPGDDARPGTPGAGENICPDCGGSGRLESRACPTCGGTGKVIEGIGGG
jgi:RecJ-like exonuclease